MPACFPTCELRIALATLLYSLSLKEFVTMSGYEKGKGGGGIDYFGPRNARYVFR